MTLDQIKAKIARSRFANNHHASGYYGRYFKVSKTVGIKVYHNSFTNKEMVLRSTLHKQVNRWMRVMNQASKFGLAPKGHFVVPVRSKASTWHVGLVMDHVPGKHASIAYEKQQELHKQLRKLRIVYRDIWAENLKVQKGGHIVLIDWDYCKLKRKRKKK